MLSKFTHFSSTVKPVNTGMPWGQTFIPVLTGPGLERDFAFCEEQTTITCTCTMLVFRCLCQWNSFLNQ